MTRKQSFEERYGENATTVLSSIAKVAKAGRSGDQDKIKSERERHYRLMDSLP